MAVTLEKHVANTKIRARAFQTLFDGKPGLIYPFHLFTDEDDPYFIDVFVYSLEVEGISEPIVAAVTNGMSDYPMPDVESGKTIRHELIQYFHECDEDHAERLYQMAWLPLFDKFTLDRYQTTAWPSAVVAGSPLNNGFFLPPMWDAHSDFEMDIDGDPVTLLWHVPISDEELADKKKNGANSLVERMEKVALPWIFDENNRPSLLKRATVAKPKSNPER